MQDDDNKPIILGKSPYAKKRKSPYRYSDAYDTWRNTGDSRDHDRRFIDPVRRDNRGGRRNGSGDQDA